MFGCHYISMASCVSRLLNCLPRKNAVCLQQSTMGDLSRFLGTLLGVMGTERVRGPLGQVRAHFQNPNTFGLHSHDFPLPGA